MTVTAGRGDAGHVADAPRGTRLNVVLNLVRGVEGAGADETGDDGNPPPAKVSLKCPRRDLNPHGPKPTRS